MGGVERRPSASTRRATARACDVRTKACMRTLAVHPPRRVPRVRAAVRAAPGAHARARSTARVGGWVPGRSPAGSAADEKAISTRPMIPAEAVEYPTRTSPWTWMASGWFGERSTPRPEARRAPLRAVGKSGAMHGFSTVPGEPSTDRTGDATILMTELYEFRSSVAPQNGEPLKKMTDFFQKRVSGEPPSRITALPRSPYTGAEPAPFLPTSRVPSPACPSPQ